MRPGALLALLGALALAPALRAAPPPLPASIQGPRIVVAFANPAHAAPAPAGTTGTRYGGDGYRVAQDAQREARRVGARYALHALSSWPIQALAMHCVVYEIRDGRNIEEVLPLLQSDPGVVLAQPLQEFRTLSEPAPASYNDPLYDLQTNLAALNIAQAHAHSQGAGLRIALIDTAVDATHPDLRGRILRTHSFVADAAPGMRHGTAMAGIIAAGANNHIGIVGIAPLAQLEVFQACWQLAPDGDAAACNTFTLAQALAAAIASGAPLVNLSIGGPPDALLAALVVQGQKRGVTFVGALAGLQAGFPTAVPGVIGAGASERPLPAGAFGAPAEHVLTTLPGAQYDFESGTSVAAAEITGVIALLMSASPTRLAPADIPRLLGERTPSAASQQPTPATVDAAAALARLNMSSPRLAGTRSAL
jgi:subtilisin family serine protease